MNINYLFFLVPMVHDSRAKSTETESQAASDLCIHQYKSDPATSQLKYNKPRFPSCAPQTSSYFPPHLEVWSL